MGYMEGINWLQDVVKWWIYQYNILINNLYIIFIRMYWAIVSMKKSENLQDQK